MPRFPDSFLRQVEQANDIVEVIGQYVALKQKGREFVGLCPFHNDKNPSMTVSPAKQLYKCFACGAGGTTLKFLQDIERITFPEAVRQLAERANIPVPQDHGPQTSAPGMNRADLQKLAAFAQRFFVKQLHSPAGADALAYARSRGLSEESIGKFGLGYAPDAWEGLATAARQAGWRDEQLSAAGLVRQRDRGPGCYDVFRNRLMFPIHDVTGKVVAFGGRALAADERAKYLNSPEGPLFDKSGMLFGLKLARDEIVRQKRVVVVEGYLDVLIPQQAGVGNVVATLGTSLTDRHVRVLSRYADEAVLLFDADEAGTLAAERALQLFLTQQLHVRVATIPSGKDPADYVLEAGGEALTALVEGAPDALQFVWQRRWAAAQAAGEAGNPTARHRVVEEFLDVIVNSGVWGAIDSIRQQSLAQHVAHLLNIPAMELQQLMRRRARKVQRAATAAPADASAEQAGAQPGPGMLPLSAERLVLEVLLDEPELFDDVAEKLDPEDFLDALLQTIARKIWALGVEGRFDLPTLTAGEEMFSLQSMIAELSFAARQRGNHRATLHEAVARLLERREQQQNAASDGELDEDAALRELHRRTAARKDDRRRWPTIQ